MPRRAGPSQGIRDHSVISGIRGGEADSDGVRQDQAPYVGQLAVPLPPICVQFGDRVMAKLKDHRPRPASRLVGRRT